MTVTLVLCCVFSLQYSVPLSTHHSIMHTANCKRTGEGWGRRERREIPVIVGGKEEVG